MISNSVFVMTVVDILIVGIVGYSLFAIPRQLQTVTEKGARKSQILAIVGLILFAFVYLADLATMHVLPWFMPVSEAMSVMADVHLKNNWSIALAIVACLSLSLVVSAQSTYRLVESLRATEIRLREEIDQHELTEQQRGASERRLQFTMDAVPVGISYLDRDLRFQFNNRNYEDLLGRSPDELKGQTLAEAIGEEAYKIAGEHARRALNGERVSFENTLPGWGDGGPVSIFVTYVPDIGSDSAVSGFYVLVQNVTEQKRLQEALGRANEELEMRVDERTAALRHANQNLEREYAERSRLLDRYMALLDATPDPIVFVDREGKIILVNIQAENITGYRRDELVGQIVEKLVPEFLQDTHRQHRQSYLKNPISRTLGGGTELVVLCKDGRELPLEISLSPARTEDQEVVIASIRDITERKEAERALRDSEERLRRLLESTHAIPWEADAKTWLFTYIGPQAEELLGYPREQWLEADFWTDHLHPLDRLWVPDYCLNAMGKSEHYEFEYRMIGSDGQTLWLLDIVNVVRENGEPVALQGFLLDITERKRVEETLRNLSARLISAHEDERRRIARELHDDFGQNLAILTVDLELFQDQMVDPDKPLADFLESQISRTKELSSKLQLLSRHLHPSMIEHIGVVSAISSFCKELSDRHVIEIEFVHDGVSNSLPGDVSLCLYRVVQESLRNVIKHSGARSACVALHQTAEALSLQISDAGSGFDPKSDSAHNGLGLLSMRERLRAVGGTISIARTHPNGTRIDVQVPLQDHDPASGLVRAADASRREI